jgi:pyridoxamine 5'-phosphate oxidase family protein
MALTDTEQRFLAGQQHGRLATVAPGGGPQVKPVGFSYNAELGSIDISGFNMGQSAKYRNVRRNPKVAFVVDEARFQGPEGVRFLEIRGVAQAQSDRAPAGPGLAPEIIRIHPRRVVSFNLDPDNPGLRTRVVEPHPVRPEVA